MRKYSNKLVEVSQNRKQLISDIILGNITSHTWSMLIKKSKIEEEYYFENIHIEDKIFLLKFINNIDKIYFLDKCLYHYFFNQEGLMHKYNYEHYMLKNIEINKKIVEIIEKYYNKDRELLIKNDTLTSYGIERSLFNIYRTTNKENTIKQFGRIKKVWKSIIDNCNYKFLEDTDFKNGNVMAIELWMKEQYTKIAKIYDREIKKYEIKEFLRKIKAFIKNTKG